MTHIAVTGANGFVGRALVRTLLARGHQVTAIVRREGSASAGVGEWVPASWEGSALTSSWPADLRPDAIVHLAARVHVMQESVQDPLAAFREANVVATLNIAKAARHAGVRRFVFVSSIKAMAETDSGRPLREDDPPLPQDPYGVSKLEAERALTRFGHESGLEVVIVRPPLVYGPEVRANFLALMKAIAKGLPLPLGAVAARRSLVYNDNLAEALMLCATHPRAAGQCFHVADATDLTVTELAQTLGRKLGKRARLIPVPVRWLRAAGRLTGRLPQVERLVDDLRVDSSRIRTMLQWQPGASIDEGLAATAQWFRSKR